MTSVPMSKSTADLLQFVNNGPSPFHVVQECKIRLKGAGFVELNERHFNDVKPLGKYFFSRNQSALIAFAVGGAYVIILFFS